MTFKSEPFTGQSKSSLIIIAAIMDIRMNLPGDGDGDGDTDGDCDIDTDTDW